MAKIIPILKPSGYREEETFLFKENLIDSEVSPIIAYGKDLGEMLIYESASDAKDFDERFPLIKVDAIKNIESIDLKCEITEIENSKILFVEENEYASEKILDVNFMKQIAEDLDCSTLMVGIPFKGMLIAIDANSPLRLKLPVLVKKYFDNPQQDRISDKIFLVQDGVVIGIGGENLPDSYDENFKVLENSQQNYTIELNSENIEALTDDLNTSFKQVMLMIMQRKAFGGEISFKLNDNIELNQTLIDKCHSYIQQIEKNEILQTISQTLTSNTVNFKFYHNENLIAPSNSHKSYEESDSSDLSKCTNSELDEEFNRIINIPNARTNIEALTTMSKLITEYKKRGIKMPNERKKWWQFWK